MSKQSDAPGQRADERGDASPAARRWVKVVVIVLAITVLIVVAAMLLGGGEHGPWQHTQLDPPDDRGTPTSTDHTPPAGVHR